MYEKNPLSPHLQIYKWQISSLLSITHRIVGVVNIAAITLISFFVIFLMCG
ncbi:MAG: succinate dehydrogenase, cytochrome b556 subunit, partial [Pelagibacteraceae bacterium]